jgi:predicted GNAT superfamily acetyltransferase
VETRYKKRFHKIETGPLPKALEEDQNQKSSLPGKIRMDIKEEGLLVEIPKNIQSSSIGTEGIIMWQKAVRRVMTCYFKKGYQAVDFVFDKKCYYVLKRSTEK